MEHLFLQHHPGAPYKPQAAQIGHLLRHNVVLHQLAKPPRTHAQSRGLLLVRDAQQHGAVRHKGRSVVHNGASAKDQPPNAREIHNPSGCGVLQADVFVADVAMQHGLLVHGDEEGADAVDDGLGCSRGA